MWQFCFFVVFCESKNKNALCPVLETIRTFHPAKIRKPFPCRSWKSENKKTSQAEISEKVSFCFEVWGTWDSDYGKWVADQSLQITEGAGKKAREDK